MPKPRNFVPFVLSLIAATAVQLATNACGEDKPKPSELVFDVTGLECGACVYSVYQAIRETKGVSDVEVMQTTDGYAKVAFDPKVVSEHQLAQAVREAFPLHGLPYLLKLRIRIPAYAKNGHAAKVDAVFTRWQQWAVVKPIDKTKGEFIIQFKPLEKDSKGAVPKGWSLAELTRALKSPQPEGLGLEILIGQQ